MQENLSEDIEVRFGCVSVDSFDMKYFCFGNGARTMAILPGLSVQSVMGSAEAVAQEYAVFTEEFTVYVFDRREVLPARYSVADMAFDTAEAFMKLGLRDIYLFGASQGGMIAMCIAQDHPELVCRLILGSSACMISEDQYKVIDEWTALAKKKDRAGLYLSFGEKLYPETIFRSLEPIFASVADTITDEELDRFIILAEGMRGFDVSGRMELITCPVLSLDADDDNVLGPEAGQLIREKLSGNPSFRYNTYSGFGHAAFDTAAPEYQDRMLIFFLM